MKWRSVRMYGLGALLVLAARTAPAQYYRQLEVADFRGAPERNSSSVAYTSCNVELRYDVHAREGVYHLKFYTNVELNPEKSWIDRGRIGSDRLGDVLRHEQGHYDLAFIEKQELLHELGRGSFDRNYQAEVNAIFNRVHEKYSQLTIDYDNDTGHSLNKTQQASWDKYFRRRLALLAAR